ncbi:MAG: hypothetical protein ACK40U_05360, partial [Fervidobacterium pennivorans]
FSQVDSSNQKRESKVVTKKLNESDKNSKKIKDKDSKKGSAVKDKKRKKFFNNWRFQNFPK